MFTIFDDDVIALSYMRISKVNENGNEKQNGRERERKCLRAAILPARTRYSFYEDDCYCIKQTSVLFMQRTVRYFHTSFIDVRARFTYVIWQALKGTLLAYRY